MNVTVKNCVVSYEGRDIPLLSGEFHYWRVLRENWSPILERIKEMGLETIATYVPWNYHELAPGRYDFTGQTSPQRDLAGFMDLVKQSGLWLIMRPGPYIYSEWEFGGVPERAAKKHRLDPQFLEWSRHYIDHVCEVIVPRQITRGGNVIMVQADNEPYPPIESFGSEMGCFKEPGVFKDWLRRKYAGKIDVLNARWRTRYAGFEEACVHFHEAYVNSDLTLGERLVPGDRYGARFADTHEFVGWYATEIVARVGGWLREAGVDVPVFANGWSPLYQDFHGFMGAVELAGTDIYPLTFFRQAPGEYDNWLYNIDIVKQQEADVSGGNVWSAEYQAGVYPIQQVGYLPPQHFRLVGLSLMARGLKGWNWYMLVNRDNWYNCPINEWGRTNEYFPVHRDLVSLAKAVEPWRTRELHDVSLFVYKPHRVADPGNFEKVYRALEAADVDYSYWNPQASNAPDGRVMIYTGADWLDWDSAGRLADWVEAGGTLVLFSSFPVRDDTGAPLDRLPLAAPEGIRPVGLPVSIGFRQGEMTLKGVGHMGRKANLFYYRAAPGEPITVTLSTQAKEELVDISAIRAERFDMGYAVPFGKGRVVHVGSAPSAGLIRLVLDQLGEAPHVTCDQAGLHSAVHRHAEGHLILFVANRTERDQTATVALNLPKLGLGAGGNTRLTDLVTGAMREAAAGELKALKVPVGAHDVAVWRVDA